VNIGIRLTCSSGAAPACSLERVSVWATAAAGPRVQSLKAWVPTNDEAESSEVPTSATGGSARKSRVFVSG